ncbi:hypothetical protein BATDEDRAFT_87290 [Batrachochytrium dendrobatidis JAM81]|uniref:Uncharacterized protein n=2 Tax=Batrachochytrium dendrobatidis TaxID=109871 RepID=F4NXP0_BATDJ|nr:uncharacterized protein BATDEDRAFT_87290 [Batrachochytrium dendrobatidis JAM81]EGF81881.1 hypothetical protein BATDEDRAFT_87290 [Batrachochytrium dendrobatidis JAM81]|eukprot:XP_006677562.1 hypothetical protein BATDEDRAFT_87290 [Batrachochytrium dendrobatidis JAM81]
MATAEASDSDKVRDMLLKEKSLSSEKYRDPSARFEADVELDAYKFLGAYLGSLTPLQFAILLGHDSIARDIIERSFKDDLDDTFGGGNTALHLATFLGAKEIVKLLLERGANRTIKNSKGFAPVDVLDDADMRKLFE